MTIRTPASIHRASPEQTMANSMAALATLESLIRCNCRQFLGRGTEIDIVTETKTSPERWRVYILKNEGRTSSRVMSESGSSLDEAFYRLHTRTAEAVHASGSTSCRGSATATPYSVRRSRLPEAPRKCSSPDSPNLEDGEVVFLTHGGYSSSEDGSESDDDSDFSEDEDSSGLTHRAGTSRRRVYAQTQLPPSYDSTFTMPRRPVVSIPTTRPPFLGNQNQQFVESPQTSLSRPPIRLPPPPAPTKADRTVLPFAAWPQQRDADREDMVQAAQHTPLTTTNQQARRLTMRINWQGHGDLRISECLPLDAKVIMDTAMFTLTRRTEEFTKEDGASTTDTILSNFRVVIKKVRVGEFSVDAAPFMANLDRLLAPFAAQIPHFEIDVFSTHTPVAPKTSDPAGLCGL